MPSSPIEADRTVTSASAFEAAIDPILPEPEHRAEFEIHPRRWIKRVLPRTMFGRSLLIVVVPLVLLQAIATWIFYDRHWAAVSWRLSAGVAGDIALLIEAIQRAGTETDIAHLLEKAAAVTDLHVRMTPGATLPHQLPLSGTLLEDQLTQALHGRLDLPYRVATLSEPYTMEIDVQLSKGVLTVDVPRDRLYVSLERNMHCAIGFCGHCQFGPSFVCMDGPVFRYDNIERFFNVREA